jgi:taurine dioxygenase
MGYQSIAVRPVTPHIGAEVEGIDLTAPLSNRQAEELHTALAAHLVLLFRDQALTPESQRALGQRFGALHIHPNVPGPPGFPELLPVHADANAKRIAGEAWHSDVSCDVEPPMGSILHLHTVPAVGGDTLFSSAHAAYEALSPQLRELLDGLTATHDGAPVYRMHNAKDGIDDRGRIYPSASHPVVRVHPVTGRRALFVNAFFTVRINELPAAESRAILAFLFEHLARPEFQMRFRWRANSVAFWDNRGAQHMALWDYYPNTRSGYRVTIKGDRPYGPAARRAA